MDRLYQGLWEADADELVGIMQELMDLAADNPAYLAKYLVNEARKTPDRKFKLIVLMENLGLKEADGIIKETLKPREDQFIGRSISIEKAIKTGWKKDEKSSELGNYFEIDPETENYGFKGYLIKLILDTSSRINSIEKVIAYEEFDLDDVENTKAAEKSCEGKTDLYKVEFFPSFIHELYMHTMIELIFSELELSRLADWEIAI